MHACYPGAVRLAIDRCDMQKQIFILFLILYGPFSIASSITEEVLIPTDSPPAAGAPATADSAQQPDATQTDEGRTMFTGAAKMLDDAHGFLSVRLVDFIDKVDTFFGDERIDEEARESYMRFGYGVVAGHDGSTEVLSRLKINLHMPRLERRLNIMIETDRESDYDTVGAAETAENTVFAGERSDVSTALRYLWYETRNWKAHADAGLILGNPLDSFVRARFRRNINGDIWNFKFTETLFWYDSKGTGESTVFDAAARVGGDDLFRATTQATWTRDTGYFDLAQTFNLFHDIDKRHAVVFQAGANGITEPDNHVEAYFFNIRGRRRLSRKWMFAEIKPQLRFPRADNFRMTPTITFLLEAFFGNF